MWKIGDTKELPVGNCVNLKVHQSLLFKSLFVTRYSWLVVTRILAPPPTKRLSPLEKKLDYLYHQRMLLSFIAKGVCFWLFRTSCGCNGSALLRTRVKLYATSKVSPSAILKPKVALPEATDWPPTTCTTTQRWKNGRMHWVKFVKRTLQTAVEEIIVAFLWHFYRQALFSQLRSDMKWLGEVPNGNQYFWIYSRVSKSPQRLAKLPCLCSWESRTMLSRSAKPIELSMFHGRQWHCARCEYQDKRAMPKCRQNTGTALSGT